MNEKLKDVQKRALEFWKKYNNKQRTIMISIALAVVVSLVVLVFLLNRTEEITLVDGLTASEVADVRSELNAAGISYSVSGTGTYEVSIAASDRVEAELAIANAGITSSGYGSGDYTSLDDALDGGLSTTEADKVKKYKAYLEDKLRSSLESLDYVKSAKVTINIPENNYSVLNNNEESSAAVVLNLKKDIDSSTAQNIAQWIATSLGNDSTASVTMIDTDGKMLFRGMDYVDGSDYSGGTTVMYSEMKEYAVGTVRSNIEALFSEAELYQSISVSPYLDMNFDSVEVTDIQYSVTDEDGDGQGPYTSSYEVEQENASGTSGIPGTDSNDEDITYEIQTDDNSSSTYTLKKYEYAVNQIITKKTPTRGTINYDTSSVSIVCRTYNVFKEEDVKAQGLLDNMTWEEFKVANAENITLDVPENLYQLVSDATGFAEDKITILAYRVPQFVDEQIIESKGITDYIPIILSVIIFLLLAFVVFKSTRPVKVEETEPELSVEALLSSTKENQPVEDIDLNDKSETRKAIEKFVDENPEAVALLLRNWLDEDWG